MSDVVLFFPKLTTKDRESRLLPASILMVAGFLVKRGYGVKIIDQRLDKNWQKTLLSELAKKPKIIGFSALTGKQILYALEASKLVKEKSSARTCWGGVHASLLPKQTLENPYVDFVIIGEGEKAFLELVQNLSNRKSYENIPGIGYKKEEKIYCNPQLEFLNLDELPPLPYYLVDIENYIAKKSFATGKPARSIAFYTSRGCPYRCGFCYNQEFNKRRWRGRSAQLVVADMEKLVKDYGITSFEIEDDEFFADLNRAKEISQLIVKKNLKIDIATSCRVNYVANLMDDDFLELISKAGFKKLEFGVETGSERIQKLIHKDIENWQVIETIKKTRKFGIVAKFFFMAGFPTETISDIYDSCDLIQKMRQLDKNVLIPAWRVFTPYPGTDLYNLCVAEGFKPPKSLEEWAGYDFKTIKMPWISAEKERIIKNVAFLIDFLELSKINQASLYQKLGRIYGKTVDFRWKQHLFWAPEKYFIDAVRRFRQRLRAR